MAHESDTFCLDFQLRLRSRSAHSVIAEAFLVTNGK